MNKKTYAFLNTTIFLFAIAFSLNVLATDFKGQWYFKSGDGDPEKIIPNADGVAKAEFKFPGYGVVYTEKDRKTLRASKEEFERKILSVDVKMEGARENTVKANIFVKDKDGVWFQSQKIFYLQPGKWQNINAEIDPGADDLVPVNGNALWNGTFAANIFCAGINIYSDDSVKIEVQCRNIELTGDRSVAPLGIIEWSMPKECGTYEIAEGRFKLTREYFNPFNPDEIKVDVWVKNAEGKETVWPAFYSQNYTRSLVFNRENILPLGSPQWVFRFTPQTPGEYEIGIIVEDRSSGSGEPEIIRSPSRKLKVIKSDREGYVRVCEKDPRYFEFSTGQFFYPIGFNIHTPKDTRSENSLKLGVIPDKGSYSYDEYFTEMQKNGVNATEIWMASWSGALEWTSAQKQYWGLGRYNLANAWKLDYILKDAMAKGIYVQLVLDNHGKLSTHVDQEWNDSPFNRKNPFAVADGAVIDKPVEIFTNKDAIRYNRIRNRYIAARWGAFTNIFGIELWSEINLVAGHASAYADGTSVKWHKDEGEYFNSLDMGKHLLTTHFCADYNMQIQHKRLYELPELAYVVGDAYRADNVPFLDLMKRHSEALKFFKKPVLITEYGQPANQTILEADLHAGLWSSFFKEQAGTPFIWWHEFIHSMKHYNHYKGFSMFMKGIDPRNKDFSFKEVNIQRQTGPEIKQPDPENGCYVTGNKNEIYGWVFNLKYMMNYPEEMSMLVPFKGCFTMVDIPAVGQDYKLSFFDTISGDEISSSTVKVKAVPFRIDIPEFKIDVAFKMKRMP
jgi:hypothetical protein